MTDVNTCSPVVDVTADAAAAPAKCSHTLLALSRIRRRWVLSLPSVR
jgi:hypothetical protein